MIAKKRVSPPEKLFFIGLASSYLSFVYAFAALAQLQVTFPVAHIVFQRNNANTTQFDVVGLCPATTERVEVMLTATAPGFGASTNGFITLDSAPANGRFSGQLTASGGWYHLDVRAIANGNVIATTRITPIGVGEVFAIAGQSNGQGVLPNRDAVGATDGRVSSVSHFNFSDTIRLPLPPVFGPITNDGVIAPRGLTGWCWGKLGDLLTQRLNVPVLFYNAAWSGTAVRNWRESITLDSTATSWGEYFMPKMPYANLKRVLQDYAPLTGLRAILWHQGEAEAYDTIPTPSGMQGTPAKSPNYEKDLKFVIAQSRQDAGGFMLPWMVARASVDNWTATFYPSGLYEPITKAQTRVIETTNRVFFGPITDTIQIPRIDGVHFSGQGLIRLANAWNARITTDFLNAAVPLLPQAVTATDLRLKAHASHRLVATGQPLSFSLTIYNEGNRTATNLRVRCQLPANLVFLTSPQFSHRKGVLLATLSQVSTNQSVVLMFTAYPAVAGNYRVAAEIIRADQLDHDSQPNTSFFDGQDDMAWVDFRTTESSGSVFTLTPSANVDPLPTVLSNQPPTDPTKADLRLMMVSSLLNAAVSQQFSVSIVLTNFGGATATNISVSCQLPGQLQSYHSPNFTFSAGIGTSTISSLAPGNKAQFVLTASAFAPATYVFRSQVTAATPADPTSTPNNGFDNGEDDSAKLAIRVR